MGKASSRKKLRREAGLSQQDLRRIRGQMQAVSRMGGPMKLSVGATEDTVHYVMLEVGEEPVTLCGEQPEGLGPAEDAEGNAPEVTCKECSTLTKRQIQDVLYRVKMMNRLRQRQASTMLKAFGG